MKIVILAAGIGSRLNEEKESSLPKPLTDLQDGRSILQHQIDALATYFSLRDIIVVVGYEKGSIIDRFPSLSYVYNPSFKEENTSKSLLRALLEIDDDVLWLNGDVLFRSFVLDKILKKDQSCMLVNEGQVGEEEVKYRMDEHGQILEVSKSVSNPQGEALGINFFKQEDLELLKQQLKKCKPSDYFEKAIEEGIKQGLAVWAVPIGLSDCVEIDFPADLVRANQLLKSWQNLNQNE